MGLKCWPGINLYTLNRSTQSRLNCENSCIIKAHTRFRLTLSLSSVAWLNLYTLNRSTHSMLNCENSCTIKAHTRFKLTLSPSSVAWCTHSLQRFCSLKIQEHGNGNQDIAKKISNYFERGQLKEAVNALYKHSHSSFYELPSILKSLFQICIHTKSLKQGKRVHAYLIKTAFHARTAVLNKLLNMYCNCGDLHSACHLFGNMPCPDIFTWTLLLVGFSKNDQLHNARLCFEHMPHRDLVSWSAMLYGYVEYGDPMEAIVLLSRMMGDGMMPNDFTFTIAVTACSKLGTYGSYHDIAHALVIKFGYEKSLEVGNSLVNMYAKLGRVRDAERVFKKMPQKNVLSQVSLLTAHLQCGRIEDARRIFDKISERDVVSWNAMISGYEQNGHGDDALFLFREMRMAGVKPDGATFVCVISACSDAAKGRQIHGLAIKSGFEACVPLTNAFISLYGSCGDLLTASCLFHKMERSVVSWNAMISGLVENGYLDIGHCLFVKMPSRNIISWAAIITGYCQLGKSTEALKVFEEIQGENIRPDEHIFSSVLSACADYAMLKNGKQIHAYAINLGVDLNIVISNTLIAFYAKCGCISDAQQVFKYMSKRDIFSWNTIIGGLSQNGCANEVVCHFEEMQTLGAKPDRVTFIALLTACNHSGLVEQGLHYFKSMSEVYHINPDLHHYQCMCDLLGRAGKLDMAERIIREMPFEPDLNVWHSLLGACIIHGNIQLGKQVAEHLL